MKITDLCPDILNSIEIEIKYAQVEKTQKDHKANITNFFRWVDSDESREEFDFPRHEDSTVGRWGRWATDFYLGRKENLVQEHEDTYERYILVGAWPHYKLDFDKETREIPNWQDDQCFNPWHNEGRWSEANNQAWLACNTPVSKAAHRAKLWDGCFPVGASGYKGR